MLGKSRDVLYQEVLELLTSWVKLNLPSEKVICQSNHCLLILYTSLLLICSNAKSSDTSLHVTTCFVGGKSSEEPKGIKTQNYVY